MSVAVSAVTRFLSTTQLIIQNIINIIFKAMVCRISNPSCATPHTSIYVACVCYVYKYVFERVTAPNCHNYK